MSRPRYRVSQKSERTLDGIVFASKREMIRYAELKQLKQAGVIRYLELQPAFPVSINDKHYCTYTADFAYDVDDEIIYEDVKSSITAKDAAYRLRKKAAELFHGVKIHEYDPDTLTKKPRKSKMKK
jgi:Protein of unknown function (DUF1064)